MSLEWGSKRTDLTLTDTSLSSFPSLVLLALLFVTQSVVLRLQEESISLYLLLTVLVILLSREREQF